MHAYVLKLAHPLQQGCQLRVGCPGAEGFCYLGRHCINDAHGLQLSALLLPMDLPYHVSGPTGSKESAGSRKPLCGYHHSSSCCTTSTTTTSSLCLCTAPLFRAQNPRRTCHPHGPPAASER